MTSFLQQVPVKPAYVATSQGQLRYWSGGNGAPLVVLPGLILGAGPRAQDCAVEFSDRTMVVFELPGIGGSEFAPARDLESAAAVIAEAWTALGLGDAPLLTYDLAAPLAIALCDRLQTKPAAVFAADLDLAKGWASARCHAPLLKPRPDGTHLTALWAHIRDRHILKADDPSQPARIGASLPADNVLDETVVAAAAAPERYEALWNACLAAMDDFDRAAQAVSLEDASMPAMIDKRLAELGVKAAPIAFTRSAVRPEAEGQIWCDYADTPSGRVHLRRAGDGPRPLLMFQSAPGSSAPLAEIIRGLSSGRAVVAPDFLGNGRSDKPSLAKTDIAALARNGLELADALGFDRFDLWGTHTGACVALELAVIAPERVGRVVLEAPPLLPPHFTSDILENYLPPLTPDRWGLHLQQAWNMRRDMFLFWPWYRQDRTAARSLGVPDAQFLHDWTVGLLSSGHTYDRSYRAAFEYDTQARLPKLTRPAMICAGPADMLVEGLKLAEEIAPKGTLVTALPATVWYPGQSEAAVRDTLLAYDRFLAGT
ncbi:alpha/beta fold hydrolase [Rhodoligotrophos ferricapiens]|uniref:alpha/beta fold hydrolase n=1 Tax=Rhodoligotrophos ferricapiens TaxID=3069264 RepID=UPI00315DBDAA